MLDVGKCNFVDPENKNSPIEMPIIGGPLGLPHDIRLAKVSAGTAKTMNVGEVAPMPGAYQYEVIEHESGYALKWTGKESPTVSKAMATFLERVQSQTMTIDEMRVLWSHLASES